MKKRSLMTALIITIVLGFVILAACNVKRTQEPNIYTITVIGGEASINSGESGTEVILTPDLPPFGKSFKGWNIIEGEVTIENNKFVIGTSDVRIEALWEETTMIGSGTQIDPYIISTEADLQAFRDNTNNNIDNYNSSFVELSNDIDLQNNEWIPINQFSGVFDGNNHSIRNYKITTKINDGSCGFWNDIKGGTVKNLGLKSFTIRFAGSNQLNDVGGFAARCSNAYIENCYAIGTINATTKSSSGGNWSANIGGFVGKRSFGSVTIKNCYAKVNIDVINEKVIENCYVGGFIGSGGSSIIENCYTTGNVSVSNATSSATPRSYVGGFAGYLTKSYGDTNYLNNCFSFGNVSNVSTGNVNATLRIGGFICGDFGDSHVVVTNCYRYSSQSITTNGTATIFINGSDVTLSQLNSANFYLNSLGWDLNIWQVGDLDFANDKTPTFGKTMSIIFNGVPFYQVMFNDTSIRAINFNGVLF